MKDSVDWKWAWPSSKKFEDIVGIPHGEVTTRRGAFIEDALHKLDNIGVFPKSDTINFRESL